MNELAERYAALESIDGRLDFQRRARLLQSMWRQERGYEPGIHRGRTLGSRLAMPEAQERMLNFITPAVADLARQELREARGRGKLFGRPRFYNDLLSSQPLCFNLFGELKLDVELASRVFADLTGGRVRRVTAMEFEHSPGRGDPRYTGDRSAFDVYVEYESSGGGRGFLGIEVKYHETLRDKADGHRERYDEVAVCMGCFDAPRLPELRKKPLQQIWRDHLLAGSMLARKSGGERFDEGRFIFLAPRGNARCSEAWRRYRACLTSDATAAAWAMEDVVDAIERCTGAAWVRAFRDRYLAFEKIEAALA